MSTSEGSRRGGRDERPGGFGGTARGFEEDAFGLDDADDGEEVYEWVDDDADLATDTGGAAARIAREPLRETLGEAIRQARTQWRTIRRRAVLGLVTAVLTGATAVGGTAWFDVVARAADDAETVNLALDAVVDGDPALAKFDTQSTHGSVQYVLELANNGPAAITVTEVSVDAGTLMTSTGWQPVGSPLIAAGATGKAALTVNLDCTLLSIGQSINSGSQSPFNFNFPDVRVSILTANGAARQVTLRSRQPVGLDAGSVRTTDQGGGEAPQTTMIEFGQCLTVLEQRIGADPRFAGPGSDFNPSYARSANQVITVAYLGVKTPATQKSPEYVLGFREHNSAAVAMTSLADPGGIGEAPGGHVTMSPAKNTIPPGGDAYFTITVQLRTCHDDFGSEGTTQLFMSAIPAPDVSSASRPGQEQLGSLSDFLTGSGLQLTLDELAQRKAACPW
jgi:hypothetical protein